MKTDKLEQFIRDNRENFDELEPDPGLWDDIEKPEPKGKVIHIDWKKMAGRAAAVVIIFIASYYFHDFRSQKKENKAIANANVENENTPLYNELLEAEFYYAAQISERKQEFIQLTNHVPGLQKDVISELGDLDAIFLELKEDLNDNANNQEVIEAMIQNYILKLEMLEEMLNQIKSKQEKNNLKDEEFFS